MHIFAVCCLSLFTSFIHRLYFMLTYTTWHSFHKLSILWCYGSAYFLSMFYRKKFCFGQGLVRRYFFSFQPKEYRQATSPTLFKGFALTANVGQQIRCGIFRLYNAINNMKRTPRADIQLHPNHYRCRKLHISVGTISCNCFVFNPNHFGTRVNRVSETSTRYSSLQIIDDHNLYVRSTISVVWSSAQWLGLNTSCIPYITVVAFCDLIPNNSDLLCRQSPILLDDSCVLVDHVSLQTLGLQFQVQHRHGRFGIPDSSNVSTAHFVFCLRGNSYFKIGLER